MSNQSERRKQWLLDNAEKVKSYKRACYLRHKDRHDAISRAWREQNREADIKRKQLYYENNREECLEKSKARYEQKKNTPEYKARRKEYYKRNREQHLIRMTMRRRINRRATPVWARKDVYRKYVALREEAAALEQTTGIAYHVDHICPVRGSLKSRRKYVRLVSGLNVDYNLQLLSATDNTAKNCFSWPDMWDYTKEDLAELAARSVPCDMELPRFNIKDYKDQEDM